MGLIIMLPLKMNISLKNLVFITFVPCFKCEGEDISFCCRQVQDSTLEPPLSNTWASTLFITPVHQPSASTSSHLATAKIINKLRQCFNR